MFKLNLKYPIIWLICLLRCITFELNWIGIERKWIGIGIELKDTESDLNWNWIELKNPESNLNWNWIELKEMNWSEPWPSKLVRLLICVHWNSSVLILMKFLSQATLPQESCQLPVPSQCCENSILLLYHKIKPSTYFIGYIFISSWLTGWRLILCHLASVKIPIIKIRRSHDRLTFIFYNGNPYTGKTVSLYWNGTLGAISI